LRTAVKPEPEFNLADAPAAGKTTMQALVDHLITEATSRLRGEIIETCGGTIRLNDPHG
jgi:hypothetical protein